MQLKIVDPLNNTIHEADWWEVYLRDKVENAICLNFDLTLFVSAGLLFSHAY